MGRRERGGRGRTEGRKTERRIPDEEGEEDRRGREGYQTKRENRTQERGKWDDEQVGVEGRKTREKEDRIERGGGGGKGIEDKIGMRGGCHERVRDERLWIRRYGRSGTNVKGIWRRQEGG